MGYYGENKARQMVRSVLPCVSQARKHVKFELDRRRRYNRRQNNQLLNKYSHAYAEEAIEMYDVFGDDLCKYIDMHHPGKFGDWDDIVQYRRDRDHLNHFIHWAEERTKHLPVEERLDYIKSILPDNRMGEHAILHLEFALSPNNITISEQMRQRKAEHKRIVAAFVNEVETAVYNVAKNDHRRREFNDYLKRHGEIVKFYVECSPHHPNAIPSYGNHFERRERCDFIRVMNGYHDAQAFLDDLFWRRSRQCSQQAPHRHTNWLENTIKYFDIEVPDKFVISWIGERSPQK